MAVQQGQLQSTDLTVDMENFYNDSVVTSTTQVDRIIQNGTQFVRLALKRAQPLTSGRADTASPNTQLSTPEWIDGLFTPTVGLTPSDIAVIGFGRLVPTIQIILFSTSIIDTTVGSWDVSTSLSNIDSEFSNALFQATVDTVTAIVVDTITEGLQFKITIDITPPTIDSTGEGMPYWRLKHTDNDAFSEVTEIQIIEPLVPTISYFDTDGSFANSFTFEKSNILDACFDTTNDAFFTIRFNSDNVGTSSINLDDDFGNADAGTASGTNNFNPARWTESSVNPQFLRVNGELVYNVATGDGQLETTFNLSGNTTGKLEVVRPDTLDNKQKWFSVRGLTAANNTIMSEGIGYETSPTTTGVWFSSYVNSISNTTASCDFREARPLWHNASDGTDSFILTYDGSNWTVTGTLTGALTDAATGVLYDETVDSSTPLEFLISCTAAPTLGEQITFDLITASVDKEPQASGSLGFSRAGATFSTEQGVISGNSVGTDAVSIELYGNTNGTVDIIADNFVVSGTESFPSIAVFTVEKTDDQGLVVGSPLIESFDIIGDSTKTYNDYLDGAVQITCTSSGTGGGFIFVKVDNQLFKFPNNVALGSEDGSSATESSIAQLPTDDINSFNWTHRSTANGLPFLTYIQFNEDLQIVNLKTIDEVTLLDTATTKSANLEISSYESNQFKAFFNQNDFDTLEYVDASANLRAFNLDDRISAFMAVNAQDITLPAGTAQDTPVNADVINAWGEALDGKVVTFSVTAGDGAVSPASDTTVSGGRATTTFTVGSTVGVSTVTATVTEDV